LRRGPFREDDGGVKRNFEESRGRDVEKNSADASDRHGWEGIKILIELQNRLGNAKGEGPGKLGKKQIRRWS